MVSKLRFIQKYCRYYLTASNGRGHGIHSPFVFQFVTAILNDNRHFYAYEHVEHLRRQLLQDNRLLTLDDFGAGSQMMQTNQRPVSFIAATSAKPKKYSRLMFRMVNYFKPETVLELGTSLGVTTAYLAAGKADAHVITMEGAQAVAEIALENFASLGLENIQIIQGNFDNTLPLTMKALPKNIDFVFMDGNHRYEPTIRYFNTILPKLHEYSVVVVDDIHWSDEMEKAWNELKQHESVTLTIDLFFIGLIFFRKENKVKQHFNVRF